MSDEASLVHLPARDIGPPATVSAEAQAHLSTYAANPRMMWPPASDIPAWRDLIVQRAQLFAPIVERMAANAVSPIVDEVIAGVPCYVARPDGWDEATGAVYLYIHGGAFVFGGGDFARAHAANNADKLGALCISVDYRMPPDHPFPAAPLDCLAVYKAVLARFPAHRIVIGGSSAGGNIAASAVLMIRDEGLQLPASVVLLTPEVDLTESGDSFRTNEWLDVVLKGSLAECNALYAGEVPLDDPYLSPLFADLTSFPPTFIQTGTRDLFLSNSVLFHRKLRRLGLRADLHVWEAMPHSGFGGLSPEDADLFAEICAFADGVTGADQS
jgi:monoterpene epsilon-lactone hydrolase